MITRITIKTPKGAATQNEKRIRKFIIGIKRSRVKILNNYVNDDDSEFIWELEAPVKDTIRIQKNIAKFGVVMSRVFKMGIVKRTMKKRMGMTKDQEEELKELFDNQTSIEIIKKATAEELVESDKTWWQRMQETFKKV